MYGRHPALPVKPGPWKAVANHTMSLHIPCHREVTTGRHNRDTTAYRLCMVLALFVRLRFQHDCVVVVGATGGAVEIGVGVTCSGGWRFVEFLARHGTIEK